MREPTSPTPQEGSPDAALQAEALRRRLDALKAELGTAQQEELDKASQAGSSRDSGAIGKGIRAGSELLAGVLVGGGIGYFLDSHTGLSPLFLIAFVLVGMAAGFWNVYRLTVPMARKRQDD
jgi:ATP synthase protein I